MLGAGREVLSQDTVPFALWCAAQQLDHYEEALWLTVSGLGDRARSIDLFEALMRGDVAAALTLLREVYDAGAEPETVISDLADFTNLVTRIKVVPAAADDVSLTPDERARGPQLSQKLGMRALSRAWQILPSWPSQRATRT